MLHLDKTLQSTVTSLAARGHGKSAALGLASAGAIAAGLENLKTLFEFICKGFDTLIRFQAEITRLLNLSFREMEYKLVMSILDPKINFMELESTLSTSDGFLSSFKICCHHMI
uniref:Uncharacterized protein n=1 Tax=Quercus lobata TaxID=97700 RepID=A0A7N2KT40_QUELO